jgi:hypothetical protein
MTASNIAAHDAHSRSHHGRERKTIRRRYRSIRSYVEKGAAPLGDSGVPRIGPWRRGLVISECFASCQVVRLNEKDIQAAPLRKHACTDATGRDKKLRSRTTNPHCPTNPERLRKPSRRIGSGPRRSDTSGLASASPWVSDSLFTWCGRVRSSFDCSQSCSALGP